jgi:hypothetical protein
MASCPDAKPRAQLAPINSWGKHSRFDARPGARGRTNLIVATSEADIRLKVNYVSLMTSVSLLRSD